MKQTCFVVSSKEGILTCRSTSMEHIRKGDDILLSGKQTSEGFILDRPPCVLPSLEGVEQVLTEKGLQDYTPEELDQACRNKKTRRESKIKKEALHFWYREFLLRPLLCLGLTQKEVAQQDVLELHDIVRENPFRILTIPLEKADEICKVFRIKNRSAKREVGEYARVLKQRLIERRKAYWEKIQYEKELQEYGVSFYSDLWSLPEVSAAEKIIAGRIQDLLQDERKYSPFPFLSSRLDDSQKEAALLPLSRGVCSINGRAGTGKTSVLEEACHQVTQNGLSLLCLSFTARAVNRMKEVLGERYKCMTIHLFIAREEDIPDYVFFDESSMTSTPLLAEVLDILPPTTRLVFVGDKVQLRPVDWGNPFIALLELIPSVTLQTNHRQRSLGSALLQNVDRLWQGDMEDDEEYQTDESFSFSFDLEDSLHKLIPYPQGRVITHRNKEVRQIAQQLQELKRGENESVEDDCQVLWYLEQPVYLTKNCYCRNLFNGSEGVVVELGDTTIVVEWKPPHTTRCEFRKRTKRISEVVWYAEDGRELPSGPTAEIRLTKLALPAEQDQKSAALARVKVELDYLRTIRALAERNEKKDKLIALIESLRDLFDRDYERKKISEALHLLVNMEARILKRVEGILLQLEGQISTSHLVPAEVLTIYRSQGAEFDQVVMYIPEDSSTSVVDRSAVYTAWSRAKKQVIVCGESVSPDMAYGRILTENEVQFLGERIQEVLPNE